MENVMLYSAFSPKRLENIFKKSIYVYLQIKYDGARVYLKDGNLYTRSNKLINFPEGTQVRKDIEYLDNVELSILDGELLVYTKGFEKLLSRKEGNGIINRLIKSTITPEELDKYDFRVMVFDIHCSDGRDPFNYETRVKCYSTLLRKRLTQTFQPVEGYKAGFLSEIADFYDRAISNGEEGIMIKNPLNKYSFTRVTDMIKMKEEKVADLKVVGYIDGMGKYTDQVGSLICETSDGKLRVSVGSGLSDADRLNPPPIGSIVSVKYNAVSDSKTKDTKSLFLPRFIEMRTDKTTANSIEELV